MVGVGLEGAEDWEVGVAVVENGVSALGDAEVDKPGLLLTKPGAEPDGEVLVVRDGAVPASVAARGEAEPWGNVAGETTGDCAGTVVPPVAPDEAGLLPAVVPAVAPGLLPAVAPPEAGLLPAVAPFVVELLLAPPAVDDNHVQSYRLCNKCKTCCADDCRFVVRNRAMCSCLQ